jgi:hypothetical protein
MTIMANDKPAPKWRNFAAWSGVGALFYILVVLGAVAYLRQDPIDAILGPTRVTALLGLGLIFAAALIGFTSWKRPLNARTLGGFAISNAVAVAAFLLVVRSFEAGTFGEVGGSETAALAVGAVFLVIGVIIAAGLANPAFGASYLNVEDAGDLREQRPVLWPSSGAMAAWGLMLVLLAAGGPAGSLLPTTVLAGAGALLAITVALTLVAWRVMDELMRGLSTEAGNMSYYLVALIGGGWAMLAHLGFAPAPAPLDWLTMLTGLALPASFIVAGRRGLLTQRSN